MVALTCAVATPPAVKVKAPRDVIERASRVWVSLTEDNFPVGSTPTSPATSGNLVTPFNTWAISTYGSNSSVAIANSGGVSMIANPASPPSETGASLASPTSTVTATGTWRATMQVNNAVIGAGSAAGDDDITLTVTESSGDAYELQVFVPYGATLSGGFTPPGGGAAIRWAIQTSTSYELVLESDGEWVFAFVNGQLIGCVRRSHATTTSLQVTVGIDGGPEECTATLASVWLEAQQPLLQAGSDKGDYVLPGTASTYPSGGLHARYSNNADLYSASALVKLQTIHSPPRTQAYAGSGTYEYQNQQDATISTQLNPTPGASASSWSAIWFGAIYLKLSAGNYTFSIVLPAHANNQAVRAWVGQTQFGTQLVDQWNFTNASGQTYSFTVSATTLAGTLSYGGGTVQRDGWYPIKIEYAVGTTAAAAPTFNLTNSPAAYTDPGGTAIASGAQTTVVPATSLSPLGCVDQRYQGVAHFDLAQQTIQAYGYQAAVEPYAFETLGMASQAGYFPGQFAPRVREGHDTDLVLTPDTGPSKDGEGILNYSNTEDATDFASSLTGNGAGFQNGTVGQLQETVFDPATLQASLYDVQGWQDFSDAAFPSLLAALLNAQLGLKLSPWQLLAADPVGRNRWAYTWPLPGSLAKMNWRPGDGLRVQARDINVQDTAPRQMLVFTRNVLPLGVSGSTASFANRPINEARILKLLSYTATRQQRNYQKQLVTLTGGYVAVTLAAGVSSTVTVAQSSFVSLDPGDQLVRARVRLLANTGAVSLNILVNNVDETSSVTPAGPWNPTPALVDIGSVTTPDANSRIYVGFKNNSGTTSTSLNFQLLVDVLR